MKLTNERVKQLIKEISDENNLTIEKETETYNLFNKLMNEEVNKNKSEELQESMIGAIAIELSTNETSARIFNRYGDNKHLAYFDTAYSQGTTQEVIDILKDYNIPSSIFRGIKPSQSVEIKNYVEGVGSVEIEAYSTYDYENEDIEKTLDIYVNGKLIYSYGYESTLDNEDFIDNDKTIISLSEEIAKIEAKEIERIANGEKVEKTIVTPKYSYKETRYVTSTGKLSKTRRYAKGTIIDGVKVGGRFF